MDFQTVRKIVPRHHIKQGLLVDFSREGTLIGSIGLIPLVVNNAYKTLFWLIAGSEPDFILRKIEIARLSRRSAEPSMV